MPAPDGSCTEGSVCVRMARFSVKDHGGRAGPVRQGGMLEHMIGAVAQAEARTRGFIEQVRRRNAGQDSDTVLTNVTAEVEAVRQERYAEEQHASAYLGTIDTMPQASS